MSEETSAELPVPTAADAPSLTTAKRLQQAELLLDLSRKVSSFETLDEMLAALVEVTTWELGAERGTLFLNDPQTGELYSRVAQGNFNREIRLLNNTGIAGHVFQTGIGEIVNDAYEDPRFNRHVDESTGFVTKNILCVPIRTVKSEVIGVAQALNKKQQNFTGEDQALLEAMTMQAAVTLKNAQFVEHLKRHRAQELRFLDVVASLTSEIDLKVLLQNVMKEATAMLNAERSTLFLNNEKTNELWSEVGEGLENTRICFPNNAGIAGAVFVSNQSVNIPHAYADLRFNPAFDKKTGFFTRSILCVPVVNKNGKTIGVTQVLNKRGGAFSEEDESRLKAFTAQVSVALENAKLFKDVQNMKNYNESMLESMSNGVLTLNEEGSIVKCNSAAHRIIDKPLEEIIGCSAQNTFRGDNEFLLNKITHVYGTGKTETIMDAQLVFPKQTVSANVTIQPLVGIDKKKLGVMIIIEDITNEKRAKSTMARYMDAGLVDSLLQENEEILGGKSVKTTVLFSDIRGFTTIAEQLGAQGTVKLLNEYFTLMVECIHKQGGMLDKFIGDALMAVFGVPVAQQDEADRAVRTALGMVCELALWNNARQLNGLEHVKIGIGINTGTVVTGNIGSPKRMDYTVIGDGVNLAARLESACKEYGAEILVSESTFKALKGTYRAREVDRVIVKGKTEAIAVYEILDHHDEESFPNITDVTSYFREGIAEYRKGNWAKANKLFGEALRLNPNDRLSEKYIARCDHLRHNPPTGEWDGVWTMESK